MLPPVINERLRLSVGAPPTQRAVGVAFALALVAFGAVFLLAPLMADGYLQRLTGWADEAPTISGDLASIPPHLLPAELQDRPSASGGWWDESRSGLGPGRFIGLVGIPVMLLGLYLVLQVLRSAAWLDGTRAQVRGALRTRTVDLSTAEVTAGAVSYRRNPDTSYESVHRVPTIIAREPGSGRRVTIALQGIGLAPLPPHELRALADAMTAGRSTAGRDGDVHTLAAQLRTMAKNPLGL